MKKRKQSTRKTTVTDIINLTNDMLVVMEKAKHICGECTALDMRSPHYKYCQGCYDRAAARDVASYLNVNHMYDEDAAEIYERLLKMGVKGAVAISLLHTCCNDLHEMNSSLPRYDEY